MDEYIGIVKLFAGSFAPQNWAFCSGQLMNVSQYSALYAILGTTYGGNGQTTFALPNLNGRVAVGAGNGQNPIQPGQVGGTANVTLTSQQMPSHTHLLMGSSDAGKTNTLNGNVPALTNGTDNQDNPVVVNAYGAATNMVAGNPAAIGVAGANQPISVMQPYLGMNYIICIQGLYPSRS